MNAVVDPGEGKEKEEMADGHGRKVGRASKSHSSLLRKCNVRSDWIKFTKRYDVMNTALNEVHQTGKGESA